MADTADKTSQTPGVGLDFGSVCPVQTAGDSDAETHVGVELGDADGVAIGADNDCAASTPDVLTINVLREAKDINPQNFGTQPASVGGQIGVEEDAWPFIQLYNLNPTGNVVVQYNKGGGAQTTTLTFDTVDQFAGAELDKASYGQGDEVHVTVTDLWLNIDPTDEDSWTFGTTGTGGADIDGTPVNATTNYQVFNENGLAVGNVANNAGVDNKLTAALPNLMCEDNCVLLSTVDVQGKGFVITLQDNDDSVLANVDSGLENPASLPANQTVANSQNPWDWATAGVEGSNDPTMPYNMLNDVPVTITEQGPNSGVFGTYDESDASVVKITTSAARGTSASIDYNETPATILVGFSFGSIDIQPVDDEWSSGEEIPVILVDGDANLNSRADEDLDFNNPEVALIPALKTGSPTTLFNEDETIGGTIFTTEGGNLEIVEVQAFSDRAIVRASSGTVLDEETFELTLSNSVSDLFSAAPINNPLFEGFALLNWDFRSLANEGNLDTLTSIDLDLIAGDGVTYNYEVCNSCNLQDLQIIADTTENSVSSISNWPANLPLTLVVTLNLSGDGNIASGTLMPMAADIFGFGFIDDGVEKTERVSNQIIRLELEETGDNTSTFEGTLEYTMVNQLNVLV
jgi:hypothetical protein